ncbi:MAG: polysaccharide deacetylase family protein, partial [Clostridia bacterium]|nr:polysaccharide deacetylase family protein [Clostridia bacterium]
MAPLSRYKKFFFLLTCVFPLVYFIVFGAATSSQVAINSYDKQIPAPTLLSASKTTTGIKIEWKPVADADGYSIYRKASNEDKFTYLRVVSASATSYLDASVPVNSVYSYQICAFQYNGIGGRIFGPFGNVKTAGFILHTDFTSVTKHPAGIQLTWSATPNADGYSIYRKAANESSFSYLKMVSSTSFLDTTVSDNTVYSYKICAYRMYNGVRYFGYFGKIQSTAHVQTPELNSPTRTSSGIMIRWNAMENISGYSIYRKSSTDSSFSYLKMVSSAETAFLDSTVKNNTVYSYKICAYVYHNGGRLFGYFSPAKQSEVIASPTISSITKTPSGLKLCWEKIPGASGYSIYRKALAEDDFVYLKMVSNTDSFVDTTADPDTIYSYKICCYYYNEAGTRKFGNFSSVQSGGGILGQEYHFITFIDDDGYNTFYEKLLPLIEEYGISISTAIETDNVGTHNFMSWETIKKCYQAGAEILNHTKEHYVTVEEVQNLTR